MASSCASSKVDATSQSMHHRLMKVKWTEPDETKRAAARERLRDRWGNDPTYRRAVERARLVDVAELDALNRKYEPDLDAEVHYSGTLVQAVHHEGQRIDDNRR